MRILISIKCIINVYIYIISSNFNVYCLKNGGTKVLNKCLFLNNKLNINKKVYNNKSVYKERKDSFVKYANYTSNYSNYLEKNKVADIQYNRKKVLNILAIETSFDDTCIAVVRSDGKILAEGSSSQKHIIEEFGGIKPHSSRDAHMETIESLCTRVIEESGLRIEDINEIAVTRGPGMELCLRVGYNFAMEISKKYNIPLVSENHIAAHCLSPMITDHQFKHLGYDKQVKSNDLKYPYLSLLVSGGHSQIYLVENPSTFYLMCDTQDQFAGSVLDKCARELGLEIEKGGGPELEKAASQVKSSKFEFTLPSRDSNYLEFCFSGIQSQLKNEIANNLKKYKVSKVKELPREIINQLAFTSQSTLFNKVLYVLDRAIDISRTFFPIKQIAVVGGVSANATLKNMIFDLLYETDDWVLFERQRAFLRKVDNIIIKYLKDDNYSLTQDNPYIEMFEKFRNQVNSLEEFIHYLWNPDLIPDLLTPGRMERVGTKHKNELYKAMICLYLRLTGLKKLYKIKKIIKRVNKSYTLLKPSKYILNMIKYNTRSPCDTISMQDQFNKKLDLYSTSKKYSTDNAVMIGFSLIEKHRMGFTSIKSEESIDGRDVVARWNLGDRKNWEILSDICKLESLINY